MSVVTIDNTLDNIPSGLQFLEILNHLTEMVWVMKPDGDIVWVNKTYLDYFGDTFQKLVVENGAWNCIHPEDVGSTLNIVGEWHAGSKSALHYRLKRYDGMYRWFLARCSMVRADDNQSTKYLIGTITDIHDQKAAEEKAKELEDQLLTVIDHAPVALWACNMNGVYTMYKGKIIEQTGISPEWFIGKCIFDITEDTPEIAECVHQAMRGLSPIQRDQHWGGRYFDLFYSPKRDRSGKVIGVVCIGVDITTRKEAGELAIKEKSARETAKLRSIFLANVSHELRTPLNGILGLAELVLHSTSPSLDPQHLTYVDSIHSSALSLLTIINQILDFSRIDSGRMDLECIPFNVKALVYEQVNIIKPLLQMQKKADRVQLMIDIADNVPDNFEGDPTRIAQVLLNLLSNAVKFTDKGSVSVKLQKVLPPVKSGSTSPLVSKSISEESMLGAGSEGRKIHSIQFSVTDSGIGISKEVQRILFEPFTQATPSTKRRYGGTGLGLSICDKLVNLMNGKLDVESDEGKGATFWFQIPLIEHPYHLSEERYAHLKEKFNANFTPNMTPEKPIAQEKPNTSKPNSLSFSSNLQGITGRLLVAEDHPVNRMLLVALLNKLGHQVTAVENGNQVVTEFVRSKTAGEKPYDLILMDCQMPEVDGYQATRFIREKEQELSASRRRNSLGVSPDTHSPLLQALAKNSMPYWKDRVPIIAITANAIETNQDKCYEAGMDDFVTKPITLQKVAQLIEKWLKEKHEVEKEKNLS